jgi:3-oxoacyl-[acyl-carrier-protein] synthase-3
VLFGDGAGAVLLEAGEGPAGLLSSELGMDGSAAGILEIPRAGTSGNRTNIDPKDCAIRMDGPEVFRRAVTAMGDASVRVVRAAGLSFDDVDLLVPHQANVRIIDATARRLRLDSSKVYVNIGSYGNTSAATIPVALTEALEEGRVRPGANIVLAAFGGGLSWAAAVVKWSDRVTPLGVSDAALPPTELSVMELLEPNFRFFGRPERAG